MALTPEQTNFLGHPPRESGRLLAGPGTGKSFTAAAYLNNLATDHPDIRAQMLTFTRAATKEFADTMVEFGITNAEKPSTIHALALRIIARSANPNVPLPIRIPDSWEEKHLILPHLTRLIHETHAEIDQKMVKKLQGEMAAGWLSLDDTLLLADIRPEWRTVYVATWGRHRRIFGYTLLAELPYRAGHLIEDAGLQNFNINLILADEYQDLNEADINLLRLLHQGGVAVVAIGDDDQSIYSWRNASPAGIRRFLEEFETQHDFPLTISQRAGRAILERAVTLISAAPGRENKIAPTPSDEAPDGHFAYLRFATDQEEMDGVAQIISARIASGVAPEKIAVLVRSNESGWTAELKPVLEARGIALATSDWVMATLAERELRLGIAYARILENPHDSLSYWALLEVTKGIGTTLVDAIFAQVRADETFIATLRRVADEAPAAVKPLFIRKLRDFLAHTDAQVGAFRDAYIEDNDENWGTWIANRLNPNELSEKARHLLELVGREAPEKKLSTVANQIEVLGKDFAFAESHGVRLMPLARSKGLTFDTAILMGIEEGLMPLAGRDLEEERRLLYVGLTRAKQVCIMTMAARRQNQIAYSGNHGFGPRRRSSLVEDLAGFNTTAGPAYIVDNFQC